MIKTDNKKTEWSFMRNSAGHGFSAKMSRRSKVAHAAFGKPGAFLTTMVLMVMTIFVTIAYMVLVRDIWAGVVASVIGRALDAEDSNYVSR